jgi:hypothetical protein|tara:strand:+ start:1356 stop:1694 length:339 start_codon:yes stop_codon:yes gene_type:complete
MSELDKKITIYLGRKPNFSSEVILQDDGLGAYIKTWNAEDKIKPTQSQLDALESQATTLDNQNTILFSRKVAYGNIENQLDQLYHDMTAGKLDATGEWHKAIKKVKDDNPKE